MSHTNEIYFPSILLPAILIFWCERLLGQVHNNSIDKEVPVLCFHQIRNYTATDGAMAKSITVTPATFTAHMKMLADSGFQSILPEDLYNYYTKGTALPARPVMITFDDNTASQFTAAIPVLNRYHFKATFFVMTVSIGKPAYMTKLQMQQLQEAGHVIAAHTWDHKNVKSYTTSDWKTELDQPFKTLQTITGKPVEYFAFPYGSWTQQSIAELQKRNIKMAFILHTTKDSTYPLLTVRRLMVLGPWSGHTLAAQMRKTFR